MLLLPVIGALLKAVTGNDTDDIQPVKANFGILPELDAAIRSKKERAAQHVARALERYETDRILSNPVRRTSSSVLPSYVVLHRLRKNL